MKPIQRFWRLLKIFKPELRQIYLYATLIGFVNLSLPLGIQSIINYIQTGEISFSWIILVVFVLMGIAVAGILQILQLRVVENIQQSVFARSTFEFAYRIPQIKNIKLDKVHAPELANRFFDTLTIQKGLPKILLDFLLAVLQIVFGIILLTIYSAYFIVLGIFIVILLWLIFRFSGKSGIETSLKESKYKYKLAHWLEEVARVSRSFKMYDVSNFHLDKADEITSSYLKARESHFKVLLRQYTYFIFIKIFVAASLLIMGGLLVFNNQINIGQFVAAEIIILLIISSIEKVIKVLETIYDTLTALDKIGYITDLDLDQSKSNIRFEPNDAFTITADNLSFRYPESKETVFKDLKFTIPTGARVNLEGHTGSGKTTLLHLLAGINKPEQGSILINGISIDKYNPSEFYSRIGVFFPSNQLFEGTIAENILIGRKIEDAYFQQIIQKLNLAQYVKQQPEGIHTLLDSGGKSLPRSIIQKLLLARILVGKPKLLLLEDPLTFVEGEDKDNIIDYLMDTQQNWTVLVIADYPYWKQKCTQTISLS